MRRAIILSAIFASAITGFGCSNAAEPNNASLQSASADNRSDASSQNPVGEEVVVQPDHYSGRINRKTRIDANPSATPDAPHFSPAPEDSEAAVMMNSDGSIREIRIFRTHKQLAKVEANWSDPKEKSVTIIFRNGKTAVIKTDRIVSLQSALTRDILDLVGLKTSGISADRPRIAIPQ